MAVTLKPEARKAVSLGSLCAVSYLAVYFARNILSAVSHEMAEQNFFAVATLAISASAMWSIYCPSLRDKGVVSGATGFLDFVSYMAAALSSSLFPHAVDRIGWGGLILVWFGLVAVGMLVTVPINKRKDDVSC